MQLASFLNIHKAKDIIVCGCGESLRELTHPERFITIGVNDVGRLFHPDYLVVVNPRRQFSGDRFRYVEQSQAKYLFTQLDLGISHPNIVKFKLGTYGGTNGTDPNVLHYTQNSPYVAVCLAAYMGAKKIGLIGVDFTENHFFAQTGRHVLAKQLPQIDEQYRKLLAALAKRGIEIVNLSLQSRLSALPKTTIEQFCRTTETPDKRPVQLEGRPSGGAIPARRSSMQKIAVEKHKPGIVGDFLDGLAKTAQVLGHEVSRDPLRTAGRRDCISVVWNGRNFRSCGPTLYCEHAWLPRWEYQVSPSGINAGSHIAPFVWDGKPITDEEKAALENHLTTIRERGPGNYEYMRTDLKTAGNLPDAFLLVPLQMEWDTNIQRHVPVRYRRMQTLADDLARTNPPLPVIYKQHPADVRRGNQQLRLRTGRRQDAVRPHERGNIHQLLKSGQCKGIISLNSNVVHDGLIWNVPSIVLGANVWPRTGAGPFETALPEDWGRFFASAQSEESRACRDAYACYLMNNQWKLKDVFNEAKVAGLIEQSAQPKRMGKTPAVAVRTPPLINVVAVNKGWFFEDLKKHFVAASNGNVVVKASEKPLQSADAWIYVRAKEAAGSPDPARTLVHIHDLFDNGLYRPGGERSIIAKCAAIAVTHPEQVGILEKNGISLHEKTVIDRPIGALTVFARRESMPTVFSAAWVGRPVMHFGKELKRAGWFVEAMKRLGGDRTAILLGERLEAQYAELRRAHVHCAYHHRSRNSIETYPGHYQSFDCVVITSLSDAGPMCLFEALATGVPVISTRVGWSPAMIKNGENGYLADSVDDIVEAMRSIRDRRAEWFERRNEIRNSLKGCTLESWVLENIDAAVHIIRRAA